MSLKKMSTLATDKVQFGYTVSQKSNHWLQSVYHQLMQSDECNIDNGKWTTNEDAASYRKKRYFSISIGHVSLPEGRQFSGMLSQHLHAFIVHD